MNSGNMDNLDHEPNTKICSVREMREGILNPPLKIALIVDSCMSTKYVYDLAKWAKLHQDKLIITHLIVVSIDNPRISKLTKIYKLVVREGLIKFISIVIWMAIRKIELKRLKNTEHSDHLQLFNLSPLVDQSINVKPLVSKSGFVYRFSDHDVNLIAQQKFDILIRCGSGILRGKILNTSKFGILSFHHADNRINRGGPPGFWEVYNKEDQTGFIIQQLTDELDGGRVVFRGAFPTKDFFLLNQASIMSRSNYYLKMLLLKIASKNSLPPHEKSLPYSRMLYKNPTIQVQYSYAVKILLKKIIVTINNLLFQKRERWGVAFAQKNWDSLAMHQGNLIKNLPNHFLADPFVITESGRNFCFLENYNYITSKAVISVYELLKNDAIDFGTALEEPFHLSFPYLFRFNNKIYMVPESSANRDIRLYECIEFPKAWKLKKIIMSNLSAADTMIFKYQERWWLFSNIDLTGSGDHCSELSIFYTDDPVDGDWTPHSNNPVIIDPTIGRNGGIIIEDDEIYRIAQCHRFGLYGAEASINQITSLDENIYVEKMVSKILPNFYNNLKGTHHLHCDGNMTVYDFLKIEKV